MAKTAARKNRRAGKLQKVLVPVDGSSFSDRAVDYAIDCVQREGPMDLHLLSVQIPIDSGHARMFATAEEIHAYHRDEGMKVLAPYLERLDAAGVTYTYHVLVGHISRTIARFAKEQRFDKVIMGTHGRTGVTNLLLGSVAQNVVRRLKIPVALVK
jgi:nucleotide-binding universal stress UspA family protein